MSLQLPYTCNFYLDLFGSLFFARVCKLLEKYCKVIPIQGFSIDLLVDAFCSQRDWLVTLAFKSWIENSTEILGLDVVTVSIVNYQIIYGAGGVHYF